MYVQIKIHCMHNFVYVEIMQLNVCSVVMFFVCMYVCMYSMYVNYANKILVYVCMRSGKFCYR